MVNSNHSQQQLTLMATTNTKQQQLTRTMSGARWKDSKIIIIIIIIIIMYIYTSIHVPNTLVMKEKESIYQRKEKKKEVLGKTKS